MAQALRVPDAGGGASDRRGPPVPVAREPGLTSLGHDGRRPGRRHRADAGMSRRRRSTERRGGHGSPPRTPSTAAAAGPPRPAAGPAGDAAWPWRRQVARGDGECPTEQRDHLVHAPIAACTRARATAAPMEYESSLAWEGFALCMDRRDAEWALLAIGLRDVHPPYRSGLPGGALTVNLYRQCRSGRGARRKPSTPAVLRPAFRSVTRRTLTSVLA
jgi:hypothetical protein